MSAAATCWSRHDRLKRDSAEWAKLPLVGVQHYGGDEPDLELRNCTGGCGSTLGRQVAPVADAEAMP